MQCDNRINGRRATRRNVSGQVGHKGYHGGERQRIEGGNPEKETTQQPRYGSCRQ